MIDRAADPQVPLRVGLIARSLATGGAERQLVKLCQTIARSDVELSVFLLANDEPNDLMSDLPADVPVAVSPFRRHHPRVIKWLADGLRAHKVDVAHSFLWIPDLYASLARALFFREPLICSERGDRGHRAFYPPTRLLADRLITFRAADRFCANSEYGRRCLEAAGCDPDKIHVIANGVDLDRIDAVAVVDLRRLLGWPATCRIVGIVSRLVWYKDIATLLHAAARSDSAAPLHVVVVGDGPERTELERVARSLGIADRVAFLGAQAPAEAYIKGFDIAVLTTSRSEACSNSVLEYMACGKPVVATNVGGNSELVRQNETGLLVAAGDPEALAQALGSLSACPERMRQMGAAGRARIEQAYAIQIVTDQYCRLWQRAATRL